MTTTKLALRKNGGIHFLTVGRLQFTFCVKKRKANMEPSNFNDAAIDFAIATGAVIAYFATIHMMFSSI
jgi:hypothetical protein